jgi:hypothetical protein
MPSTNLQQYTLMFVTLDGPLLAQEQHVTVNRNTHAQQVATVPLRFSGVSPGAAMVELEVKNAIPATGFEFDAGQNMLTLAPAKIYILGPGGKTLKGQCIIHQDSSTHGVNAPAEYNFSAWAPMAQWE